MSRTFWPALVIISMVATYLAGNYHGRNSCKLSPTEVAYNVAIRDDYRDATALAKRQHQRRLVELERQIEILESRKPETVEVTKYRVREVTNDCGLKPHQFSEQAYTGQETCTYFNLGRMEGQQCVQY